MLKLSLFLIGININNIIYYSRLIIALIRDVIKTFIFPESVLVSFKIVRIEVYNKLYV